VGAVGRRCVYCVVWWGRGNGVGTGMVLQLVLDLSLLVRKVCCLCCRGLASWLRWWGGKYILLIGLKKAGVSWWLGRWFGTLVWM